ncbi:unnamed protein product [Echinostoma caproni]|uniref:C2H2-type domain-containing protein n=1 Tax=Echinostoma caproni TaxID=27848 RepID=A0A183AH81_9TREM|nr:unnamed protein product [Echinostoma caproni]
MSSTLLDKRRLKDRNRNFNPRWEEEFAFINFGGRPLCLICNVALTHFKSCNLKRHYETHHKSFAIEYPPWSERRRKRLLALKVNRTHQDVPMSAFDEETRLATEAGFVISQACAQNSRLLSEGESCKQLVLDVVSILDPLNGRLRQLIDDIPLVRSSWLKSDGSELVSDTLVEETAPTSDAQAASDDSRPTSPKPIDHHPNRSLSQLIEDIEHASGCFICSACLPSSADTNNPVPFACSDPIAFRSHLASEHPRLTSLVCAYCNLCVQCTHFVSHVSAHFFPDTETATTTREIFTCPAEPECDSHFASSQYTALQVHWNTHHADPDEEEDEEGRSQQFKCPHCTQSTFTSLTDWAEHIQQYARPLVHCGVSGCLVKSPSRSLLLEHVARKHVESTETLPANTSALIHETFEVRLLSAHIRVIQQIYHVCSTFI